MKRFRLQNPVLISWLLLGSLMLFYAVWMSDQVLLRYNTFIAGAFDLGNMDQAIWNTLHSRPLQFTNHGSDWYGYPIRLAQHVEPIIFLLSLLYLFHADPQILLIFQTLALTSGALPVFLLTRRFIPVWPLLAPVMAAAYLLSPALMGENLYDFHPVALATPLLLYTVLALTYRRYAWFVLCCILAAACKEEIPLVLALLGLLIIWKYKLPRLGIILLIGGILWSLLAFLVIEPHFNVGAHTNTFWYRYATLGSSPKAAIINILLHPWLLFTTFFTLDRLYYLINLLRSTGFLALLGPEWLLPTLFSLAINLLSGEHSQYSGVYQYNAAIIPFVMIAAIHGTRRFTLLWHSWRGEIKKLEPLREVNILIVPVHHKAKTDTINVPTHTGNKSPNTGGYAPDLSGEKVGTRFIASVRPPIASVRYLIASIPHHILHTNPDLSGEKVGTRFIASVWPHIASARHLIVSMGHLLASIVQRVFATLRARLIKSSESLHARGTALAQLLPVSRLQWCCLVWIVGMIGLNYFVMFPKLNIFWANHQPGNREQHIAQLLAMIPPDAPISAGGTINPHLTERQYITVFPELDVATMKVGKTVPVQYVIVDLYDVSPEDQARSTIFLNTLNWIERSHQFRILARAEGVVLLERNNL